MLEQLVLVESMVRVVKPEHGAAAEVLEVVEDILGVAACVVVDEVGHALAACDVLVDKAECTLAAGGHKWTRKLSVALHKFIYILVGSPRVAAGI
jgi:hypothetical protein